MNKEEFLKTMKEMEETCPQADKEYMELATKVCPIMQEILNDSLEEINISGRKTVNLVFTILGMLCIHNIDNIVRNGLKVIEKDSYDQIYKMLEEKLKRGLEVAKLINENPDLITMMDPKK